MIVTLVLALATRGAGAQSGEPAQCFGFSFGTWSPPLDLWAAGHGRAPSPATQLKAPGGRDWASDAVPNDTTLLLFPAWWPAGVQVTFPRRPSSTADTVTGQALAVVADGRATPPRAAARAWRVACR
ncbi:MAG: hypothetical protein ACREOG_00870 [Gemmatimonadaceae bacterium]